MDNYMEMPDKEGKTVWTKKEESKDGSWVETKVEKVSNGYIKCVTSCYKKEDMWDKVAEEMADCVIRIFDFCEARELDLETAIWEKMNVNKKRPKKHGKMF